jgi:hypothetical protein
MIRHLRGLFLAAAVAGCAGAATREEGPLDRLISKSNAYTSFHLRGEITDGKQSVPVELAYKAPDRAFLRYGSVMTTIFTGGRVYQHLRGSEGIVSYAETVSELKTRYPGLEVGRAPEPVFTMGDGVRALLSVGRLGARLGWLDELRTYQAQGNVYRHGQTEIELRDDGFIARTSIAGHGFVLKDVKINEGPGDDLFVPPSTTKLAPSIPNFAGDAKRSLEESYRRWILETSTSDDTLNAMIGIDLAAKYQPEKMAELLRQNVRKSLNAFHALKPDAQPEAVRHKIEIERGKAMGSVDIMEEELQKDFEKALDGYFRGMAVTPPQKEMLDVLRRWREAVKRQVDEQIRRRFEAVFADAALPRKE